MNRDVLKKQSGNEFGFANIKILMTVSGLALCVGYLCAINISAVKGYEIKNVEQEISKLKKENEQLQIRVAELRSSYNIKEEVKNLNMVEADNVVYISENGQTFAAKR